MMTLYTFLIGSLLSLFMAIVCVALHYEGLTLLGRLARKKGWHRPPRVRMMSIMLGVVLLHTLEIWIFGVVYYGLENYTALGGIQVINGPDISVWGFHYVYYSAVLYTSLGFGDMIPTGVFRMLAGTEALVGLLMIAWSASFTYLLMEKLWEFKK